MMQNILSPCARTVKLFDWDRYFCSLFAPLEIREDVFTLLAFNSEIARTPSKVKEPLLGELRLNWWRSVIDNIYDDHTVPIVGNQIFENLPGVIKKYQLSKSYFDQLIVSRMKDLLNEPYNNREELVEYAYGTSGVLNKLLLGMTNSEKVLEEHVSELGIAWALTGLMRNLPNLEKQGRSPIPKTYLGVPIGKLAVSPKRQSAIESLCNEANNYLERSKNRVVKVTKENRFIFLISVLNTYYLKQLASVNYNPHLLNIGPGYLSKQLRVSFGLILKNY